MPRVAVVVVDMWDKHWCKSFTKKLDAFVPRLNVALDAVRAAGLPVVFMPASVIDFYAGWPQRQAVYDIAPHKPPPLRTFNPPMPADLDPWPFCECSDGLCVKKKVWTHQHPDLTICAQDLISDNMYELYNLYCELSLWGLIYVGASANLCILSRPYGVVNMMRHGVRCAVAGDMVLGWEPTPEFRLEDTLNHIRKHIAPVVSLWEIIDGSPITF